jgi:hypothetical protein
MVVVICRGRGLRIAATEHVERVMHFCPVQFSRVELMNAQNCTAF